MFLTSIDPYMNTLIIFGIVVIVIVLGYFIFFAPKRHGKNEKTIENAKPKELKREEPLVNEQVKPEPQEKEVKDNEPEEIEVISKDEDPVEVLNSEIVEEPSETKEDEVEEEKEPEKEEPKEEIVDEQLQEFKKEVEKANGSNEEISEEKEETKELGKYHVLYRKDDNKWYVKREGSDKVLRVLETQAEAIAWATIKALNQDTTIIIHKRDGKIRKQNY
jgi:type IV secretory pathway VirB10-like protein